MEVKASNMKVQRQNLARFTLDKNILSKLRAYFDIIGINKCICVFKKLWIYRKAFINETQQKFQRGLSKFKDFLGNLKKTTLMFLFNGFFSAKMSKLFFSLFLNVQSM